MPAGGRMNMGSELATVKKSKSRVVKECKIREAKMKKLAYLLLGNVLGR